MRQADKNTKPTDNFDIDGEILFIDLAIAPNREVLRCLGLGIMQRFGHRKEVVFKNKGQLRRHDLFTARRALLRKSPA